MGLARRNGEGTRAMSVSGRRELRAVGSRMGRLLACKLGLDSETMSWVSRLLSVPDAKSAHSNMFENATRSASGQQWYPFSARCTLRAQACGYYGGGTRMSCCSVLWQMALETKYRSLIDVGIQ
jgi:hypothetical protein